MEQFLENLTSPGWWLGVVLIGVVINIFSAFLKPRLESTLGRFSVWWATRTKERKARFDKAVARIKDDPDELVMASFSEMRNRMMTLHAMLVAAVSFLFGIAITMLPEVDAAFATYKRLSIPFFYACGTLMLAMGQLSYAGARRIWQEIRAAKHAHEEEPA